MEHSQKKRLHDDYPDLARNLDIEVLDIPDDYQFMDPALIELIRERVEPLLSTQE